MKKAIAVILSVLLVFVVLPIIGFAEETPEIPEGYTPIYTKDDLDNIRLDMSGKYILMNDLVFTDEDYAPGGDFYNYTYGWNPIGTSSNPFTGELDGNNHIIDNLKITNPDQDYQGLFGFLNNGAVVQNLELNNIEIQGVNYVGSVSGYTDNSSSILNCTVNGSISGNSNVGGITGYMNGASNETTIQNCIVIGTVSGTDTVGGIVGYMIGVFHDYMSGGHSYSERKPARIIKCINASAVYGNSKIGGICGYAYSGGATISTSFNMGTVNASELYAGGLFGYIVGTGNNHQTKVNGVTHWSYWITQPSASNCFNSGNVSAGSYSGGLVGFCTKVEGASGTFGFGYGSCYNVGHVFATQEEGYYGPIEGKGPSDCYALFLDGICEAPTNTLGTSKTDEEFKRPGAYGSYFDFDSIWEIIVGAEYPYATLKDLPHVDDFTACPHENTELQNASAATCTENGYTGDLVCLDCGETIEEGTVINALGHDYVDHPAQAPTCSAIGWIAYQTCSRCDFTSYEEMDVDPTNHVNTVDVPETFSTCITPGYTAGVYCNDCRQYISGHVEKALADHTWNNGETLREATCNQKGLVKYTCTVPGCGETKTVETAIAPNNHNYVSAVTAPTCTAQGYTTYTCTRCGDNYRSDYVNALGHSYTSTVTPATCAAAGYTTYTCVRGDHTSTADYTDPLGHVDNNGDGYCDYGCGTTMTPVDPGDQGGQNSNACKYCGKVHPNTAAGRFMKFIHDLLFVFARLFGMR